MNPAQPNVPSARGVCFLTLEQAYVNSLVTQWNTQKQIDRLLNRFQHLEKLIQETKTPPIPPQTHPTDPTPVQTTPTRWPPSPALPSEYSRNCSQGQTFLTSCQTYICLCPDSFPDEHIKITWVLSYMKSRWAAKWAEQVFQWEEKHGGYSNIRKQLGGLWLSLSVFECLWLALARF